MAALSKLELYSLELLRARVEEGIEHLGPVHVWCGCKPGTIIPLTLDQKTQLDSERRASRTAFRRLAERN
jgi:hypothetical protein